MLRKLPLILILAIGILTPVVSTALFFFWKPDQFTNHGEVLRPTPVQTDWERTNGERLDTTEWAGKWILVFASGGECGADCQKQLCQSRQLHRMLHGHYLRVGRAWVITDRQQPPTTLMQKNDCGELDNTEAAVTAQTVETLENVDVVYGAVDDFPSQNIDNSLFVIDPYGNWAMRFDATVGIFDIRDDLKKLLRLSKGHKKIEQ